MSAAKKAGVIYILTNPSFPDYVKIGYATNIENRLKQLNRSECIPFAFRVYATYVDALHAGVLQTEKQKQIAERLYAIMTAFAKTGLVAVIDEVTGYQADRDRDELQKVLEKYISAELLPWTKRFPDEFYKQMFRLKGWQYKGKAKTPYAGKLTNEYIYSYLPDGVLDELKKTTPKSESGNRKNRFHQHLTEETGLPNLDKQLQQTIALMKASDTWEEFDMLFKKAMGEPVQMSLEDKSSEVVNNSL